MARNGLHETTRNWHKPRSRRVRRQAIEPRTRGLRVCVLTSSAIPGYVRAYRAVPVHARQPAAGCRMVPAADGQYHGIRANNEQTCQRMILAVAPGHDGSLRRRMPPPCVGHPAVPNMAYTCDVPGSDLGRMANVSLIGGPGWSGERADLPMSGRPFLWTRQKAGRSSG